LLKKLSGAAGRLIILKYFFKSARDSALKFLIGASFDRRDLLLIDFCVSARIENQAKKKGT